MSDRFHASLEIGGPVSKDLIPELASQISGADLLPHNGPLEQHINDDGLLVLEDEQAPYGEFPDLEAWLEEHDIEFDRHSSSYIDLLPEWVSFRRGQGGIVHLLDGQGDQVISHHDVAQALAECNTLSALQAALAEILGPLVHPLNPINFNIKE